MIRGIYIIGPEWRDLVYGPEERAELARFVDFASPPQTADSVRENLTQLSEVEVIFCGWGMPMMDAAFLAAAPKLRAVFHAAGTVRYIAGDAFWARNLIMTTAAAANAVAVADYTLAAIFFSLRHGWYYERGAHANGAFPERRPIPGSSGSVIGLISLGLVGRQVAERLRTFDVEVIAYDPFLDAHDAGRLGVSLVALDEIFARADIVSLHAPWLKETEGMITAAHFSAMKEGATFINTARGAVVREQDMINVLRERPDLSAVLDVTWPEPPAAGSPLYGMANVILTPHIAATTGRECRRLSRCVIDEFHRWRRGEPLRYAITKDEISRRA
jgi:phosphoglycerate dehydrogenase-like enzyme